jgi:ABC-type antimicrobial peptide transport system permease subunit
MFKNYFKTAWRNIVKDKGYSLLNILGLSTGMAVALLIGLWVSYQFSFDRFLPGYSQVYQANYKLNRNGDIQTQQATSVLLAGVLKQDIPEVKYTATCDWMNSHSLMVGDKKLYLDGAMAGSDFLNMFQYPFLEGNAATALQDPYSIVLTKATAISLFGKEEAINKTVRIDNLHDLKVTGVLKDIPGNSTFRFNYVVPFEYKVMTEPWLKAASTTWNNNSCQTFVALQPGVSYAQVESKMKQISKHFPAEWAIVQPSIFLHPLKDWHLLSEFKNGIASGGFIDYVKMFSIIGILVLIIACINFTNLSTARSERRAKEVGVRKAIGSGRKDLILQFLVESIVLTVIAFLFALALVQVALPAFNMLTKDSITLPWSNNYFWLIMLSYVLLTGLLAGSRPAFYLSSFQPVKVLKGVLQLGKAATLPRKVLVVLQFSCSIALITSTAIIYQQIQYAKNRPTGYDTNRLMMTDGSSDIFKNFSVLKQEMLATGLLSDMTRASSSATGINSWSGIDDWHGKYANETLSMATIGVDDGYFKTLGMQFIAGKNFFGDTKIDSASLIINEAAAKRLRLKDPVNEIVYWNDKKPSRIIGVVKDALMLSPFSNAEPTFFVYAPGWSNSLMYRLKPTAKTQEAISRFSAIFNKYNPAYPYIYHFADESYAEKFNFEVLIGKLSGLFAALAIFISCLGLFGLAAYVAQQRTKEIGIRKVLGASVAQLWTLLSKDFIVLVLISCVIASPVAWYFLNGWLLKYDYRITIGPGVFIYSTLAALLITIITISFQAIKAAMVNPAKSLRTE